MANGTIVPMKAEVTAKPMKWYIHFDGDTTIYPGDVWTLKEVRKYESGVGNIETEFGYGVRLVSVDDRLTAKTEWEIMDTAEEACERGAEMEREYAEDPESFIII